MLTSLKSTTGIGMLGLLLSVAACASDSGGTSSSFAPLVPESTGWTRIASITSPLSPGGEHDRFAVTAYDLQVDGETLRVFYSVDTLLPAIQATTSPYQSRYYTAQSVLGASDAPTVTSKQMNAVFQDESDLGKIHRFQPGHDTLETLYYTKDSSGGFFRIWLFDDALHPITDKQFQFNGRITKTLPNGDLLAGDVGLSLVGELEHYHRATNTWSTVLQSAGDGQWLNAYTPFELDDAIDLAFRLYAKDDKAFLSIADFVPTAQYPDAPYAARFTEEHPEYARTGVKENGVTPTFAAKTSVAASVTTGKSLTVVLVSQDNVSGAYTLSAYSWTAGATSFTKLYGGISISKGLGDLMNTGLPRGARETVQCHADGTIYALVNENDVNRLALVGADGEKSLGVVPPQPNWGPVLSQLRFVGGAYYAAVGLSPVTTTYEGPKLEIVKLIP